MCPGVPVADETSQETPDHLHSRTGTGRSGGVDEYARSLLTACDPSLRLATVYA